MDGFMACLVWLTGYPDLYVERDLLLIIIEAVLEAPQILLEGDLETQHNVPHAIAVIVLVILAPVVRGLEFNEQVTSPYPGARLSGTRQAGRGIPRGRNRGRYHGAQGSGAAGL